MERRKEAAFNGQIFVPRRGAADDAGLASRGLFLGGIRLYGDYNSEALGYHCY